MAQGKADKMEFFRGKYRTSQEIDEILFNERKAKVVEAERRKDREKYLAEKSKKDMTLSEFIEAQKRGEQARLEFIENEKKRLLKLYEQEKRRKERLMSPEEKIEREYLCRRGVR